MNNELLLAVFVLYAIATLLFLTAVVCKKTRVAKIGTLVMLAALVLQVLIFFIYHWQGISAAAFGAGEFALSLSLFIVCAFLVFQAFTKTHLLGAFVAPTALSLSAVALIAGKTAIPSKMAGGAIAFHIAFAIVGEALFIIAALAGALFLIQERLIKKKGAGVFIRLLPPLVDLDNINHHSLLVGFPLLTIGLLVGVFYIFDFGGLRLLADSKSVWAALMWICYALVFYQRHGLGWRGRKVAWTSLASVVVLLVSFFFALNCPVSWHRFL